MKAAIRSGHEGPPKASCAIEGSGPMTIVGVSEGSTRRCPLVVRAGLCLLVVTPSLLSLRQGCFIPARCRLPSQSLLLSLRSQKTQRSMLENCRVQVLAPQQRHMEVQCMQIGEEIDGDINIDKVIVTKA